MQISDTNEALTRAMWQWSRLGDALKTFDVISKQVTQYGNIMRPYNQFIQAIEKNYRFVEYINNLSERLKDFYPLISVAIAQRNAIFNGWALPIDRDDFCTLCTVYDNDDIIYAFEQNEMEVLHNIQQDTSIALRHRTHKKQFAEAVKCYELQMYYACIASLVPLIEGTIQNPINPKSTNVKKSLEFMTKDIKKFVAKDSKELRLIMILSRYINWHYAPTTDFTKEEPEFINRHWAAHGKYTNKEMSKIDCLQLFSALYVLTRVVCFCSRLNKVDL